MAELLQIHAEEVPHENEVPSLEWHPQHLHEVVAVAMVVKNWLRPRDRSRERQRNEELAATNEVNTSLVFEPMALTMERIRVLKQLGRQPSQNSLLLTGKRTGSKLSSVNAPSPTPQIAPASPKISTVDGPVERKLALTTGGGEEEGNVGIGTTSQDGQAIEAVGRSNGNAVRDRQEAEPMEATGGQETSTGQERELLGTAHQSGLAETVRNWCRGASRAIGALPHMSVDPTGDFYAHWTFLVHLVFLYNAFMCVLCVFDDTSQSSAFLAIWLSLNGIFDCVNLLDMFINSRLTYLDDGMLVKDWHRLTKRYMHGWHFPSDLCALFPLDLLLIASRSLSLARVNRLAKFYRAWEFVQMTNVRTDYPNAFRILHIVIVCVVLFHWNAALYFKISLFYGIFSTDPSAWEFNFVKNQDPIWVSCGQVLWDNVGKGECGFNETGRGDPDVDRANYLPEMVQYWHNRSRQLSFSNFSKQYSLSFYWSSLTLTTSGQQPYPTAAMHNFLEIFDTIVGVLVFAVIVGSVGNVVTTMNRGRAEIQQLNDGIKFYMNYRNVSAGMQKRVLDCIHYIQRHAQIQNEGSIMSTIPPRLRGELAVHLHMESLRRVELLSECEPSLLYELVMRLRMQMFAPNDFICRKGDLAKEMYVLKRGVLEVFADRGEQFRMGPGSAFGEMAILKAGGPLGKLLARRKQTLRSLGYSEVYLLSQEDALAVFGDYPEQRQFLLDRAKEILLSRGEAHPEDFAKQGPFSPVELCGTESTIEVFSMLEGTLAELDVQLDHLYTDFKNSSSELKQQVSGLEADYQLIRQQIKGKKKKRKENANANL